MKPIDLLYCVVALVRISQQLLTKLALHFRYFIQRQKSDWNACYINMLVLVLNSKRGLICINEGIVSAKMIEVALTA